MTRPAQRTGLSMGLSRADIEKVALLARLQLTEDEAATMTAELGQIVGYVDQLAEVNTEGVEPKITVCTRMPGRRNGR